MLRLDTEGIRARIDNLFGGSDAAVVARWPTSNAPNRSTLGRWLKRQSLPRTEALLLGLAGALDIDPVALWEIRPETFPKLIERVAAAAKRNRWGRIFSPLAFLADFIEPSADWPPNRIAGRYFRRDWNTFDFLHESTTRQNYYAPLCLTGSTADQVWHFAWRTAVEGSHWRPYGFVRLSPAVARLFSFDGVTADVPALPDGRSLTVETWFGEQPAAFRIASLHEFRCDTRDASPSDNPVLRFP